MTILLAVTITIFFFFFIFLFFQILCYQVGGAAIT